VKGALATYRASERAGPARQSRRRVKLMLVDDSMVARAVLSRMIDADGNFEIAGIAGTWPRTRLKPSAR
jgi:two-component system, chemotaxis family, protein-glutamate methylesterase/glutaminase